MFVDPVICSPDTRRALQQSLLLLYTGLTRSADDILREQARNTQDDASRREVLRAMVAQTEELRAALVANDLRGVGEVLHQGWLAKRRLATGISSPRIDAWYERARRHGAIGGKITGAGGGGFLLLYAPPERHQEICQALPELPPLPFACEPQGSKIIYVEENA